MRKRGAPSDTTETISLVILEGMKSLPRKLINDKNQASILSFPTDHF